MFYTYNGSQQFYTDTGSGSVLLLLHGFLENHKMWDFFLPTLSSMYRVITVDLPGHGQSDCLGYIHSMEAIAQGVRLLCNELDIKELTLIGHSMGGYVGCAFAKANPEMVNALCLLNSSPKADSAARKELRQRANHMAKDQFTQLVRMSFTNLFSAETRKEKQFEIKKGLTDALQTPIQGYIANNEGMRLRTNHTRFWKQTSIRKGMILGIDDWIIDAQAHLIEFGPYTHFFKRIETGHMSALTAPELTLASLLDFLK